MSTDWEDYFTERCPSLVNTFSGAAKPCTLDPETNSCLFEKDFCDLEHKRDRRNDHDEDQFNLRSVLTSSYHSPIHVTLAEPAGSFVLRSEHLFHGQDMFRMSVRRHLYEVLDAKKYEADCGNDKTIPAHRCPKLQKGVKLGSYVGYVDLRPMYHTNVLALGVLAVPRRLQQDPDAHIITGNYSELFGGPAFACNIYTRQDDRTAGAACAQACMIMVLGMLADRGARLEGSYTLTQIGHSMSDQRKDFAKDVVAGLDLGIVEEDFCKGDPQTLKKIQDELELEPSMDNIVRIYQASGLTPEEITYALGKLNTQAALVVLSQMECDLKDDRRRNALEKLARKMIECYIQARYPVILGVSPDKWEPARKPQESDEGHAVVVVGVRKSSEHLRQPHFIVHDPAKQPFLERSANYCFNACWAYNKKHKQNAQIEMIMPTEASVTRPLRDCVFALLTYEPQHWLRLFFGKSNPHPDAPNDLEYQFALLYAKDLHVFLSTKTLTTPQRNAFNDALNLSSNRYWCVAGYLQRRLVVAWLFATDSANGAQAELKLIRGANGLRPSRVLESDETWKGLAL